jgi:teichuronic acid biosynthesis glycosyltransferase TuaH
MQRDVDIVWLSLDRCDNKYSSTSFSMAKELSKTHRVFFIDNPATYGELMKKTGKDADTLYTRVPGLSDNFLAYRPSRTLPINWLNNKLVYGVGSAINNWRFMRSLKKFLNDQQIERYIFVNVFDPFYARKITISNKPILSVYYSVDDIRYSPYVKKHGPRLEQEIVKNYDLTLTTSRELQRILSQYGKNVVNLPNAANIDLFKSALQNDFERPSEIKDLQQPIIIYTGHLDWRLEIDILVQVAKQHHDKILLLVGPISLKDDVVAMLKGLGNVIFTGSKPIEQLPAFLHFSTCAIIPFKCNTLTASIYPLKINEYLAAGLPVVSTDFSEDIRQFEKVIALENNPERFASKIGALIASETPAKQQDRISLSENNTWSARAKQFWEIVSKSIG